jgi:hypothetical protein
MAEIGWNPEVYVRLHCDGTMLRPVAAWRDAAVRRESGSCGDTRLFRAVDIG